MWICTCPLCIGQSSTGELKKISTIQPIWSSTLSHVCELIGGISLAGKMQPQGSIQQQHPTTTWEAIHLYRPILEGGPRSHPVPRSPRSQTRGTLKTTDPSSLVGWKRYVSTKSDLPTKRHWFLAVVIQVHWSPQLKHPGLSDCPIKMQVPKTTTTYASPENFHEPPGSLEMSHELGSFHVFFKVP